MVLNLQLIVIATQVVVGQSKWQEMEMATRLNGEFKEYLSYKSFSSFE